MKRKKTVLRLLNKQKAPRETVYFCRGLIDLDFNLPYLKEIGPCKIIVYQKAVLPDYIVELAKACGCEIFVFPKTLHLLGWIIKKRLLGSRVQKFLLAPILLYIYSLLGSKKSGAYFLFDHTDSFFVKCLCDAFKAERFKCFAVDSLPHGIYFFQNRITDHGVFSVPKPIDMSHFQTVFVTTKVQATHFSNAPIAEIPVLRYSDEWLDFVNKECKNVHSPKLDEMSPSKLQVLVLHSKISGNLDGVEVFRALRILANSPFTDVFVKIHPRTTVAERKSLQNLGLKIIEDVPLFSLVDVFEHIFLFQSSAIFDLMAKRKTIHLLDYVSSNRVYPQILKQCNLYSSPDDVFSFASGMMESAEYKKSRPLSARELSEMGLRIGLDLADKNPL